MCYHFSQSQPGWSRAKRLEEVTSSQASQHLTQNPTASEFLCDSELLFPSRHCPSAHATYRKAPSLLASTQHHNSLKIQNHFFSPILSLPFQGQSQLPSNAALTVPSHRETGIQRLILEFLTLSKKKIHHRYHPPPPPSRNLTQ